MDENEHETVVILTAPERIWLQVSDSSFDRLLSFPDDHDGITWCAEQVMPCEVEYVRADLLAAERERLLNSVTGEPYRILHVHVNEDTGQLHEHFIKPEDAGSAYYDTCKEIIPLFRADDIAAERERVKKECADIVELLVGRDTREEVIKRISELK